MTDQGRRPAGNGRTQGEGAAVPVRAAESGQKLLQLLRRRLSLPTALLHRWIRTGQVRVNGGRCQPFTRLRAGDVLRLPPFAQDLAAEARLEGRGPEPCGAPPPLPPLLGREGDLWAFAKPAGLPVHSGTGHADSLAARLAAHFPHAPFRPTPVHRLDKDTSGVLLVAASYESLAAAQAALRAGAFAKEYVAWVRGPWPWPEIRLLRHFLRKEADGRGLERVVAVDAARGKEALCLARPLAVAADASLMHVRLLTGRTHQVRVQMASAGCPVLGDARYGGGRQGGGVLYLHALRLVLPSGRAFCCLPPWTGKRALAEPPGLLDAAVPHALGCGGEKPRGA